MTDSPRQLISYIAPSAPATRRPADGDGPYLRPEIGFTPRWYHQALGIDFGRRWHTDPAYRRDTVVAMQAELRRRFPGTRIGGIDKRDEPLDLLTGTFNTCVVAGVYGHPTGLRARQLARLRAPASRRRPGRHSEPARPRREPLPPGPPRPGRPDRRPRGPRRGIHQLAGGPEQRASPAGTGTVRGPRDRPAAGTPDERVRAAAGLCEEISRRWAVRRPSEGIHRETWSG